VKLRLLRISSQNESTLGILFDVTCGVRWLCFTLEDEYRTEKVYGETRIPSGTYKIMLRTDGNHHDRYSRLYPTMHVGMLELQDVPNFTGILIHIGNTDKDTEGCLLVGDTAHENITELGRVGKSVISYKRVYPIIAKPLVNNEEVTIRIVDYDSI